jgi:hypothetical protein
MASCVAARAASTSDGSTASPAFTNPTSDAQRPRAWGNVRSMASTADYVTAIRWSAIAINSVLKFGAAALVGQA